MTPIAPIPTRLPCSNLTDPLAGIEKSLNSAQTNIKEKKGYCCAVIPSNTSGSLQDLSPISASDELKPSGKKASISEKQAALKDNTIMNNASPNPLWSQ